jgi:V/A-type H+-transporting ATPase subunit E
MPIEDEADFSQAILEEAKQEAEGIVDRAKREAERILDGARAELDQIYLAEAPQTTTQKAKMRYNQIIAAAELETRKQKLLTQERLIAKVQKRVKERLLQIRNDPRYSDILVSLIHQGVIELEGDMFEAIVAPEDCNLVTKDILAKLHKDTGKTIVLSEQAQAEITGAIIQRTDKRVRCDNSFQAILQRRQNELRLLIAQELFGEVEEI